MVNCPGCLRAFSYSGYTSHIRRTTNVNCKGEFHAQLNSAHNHDMDGGNINVNCMDNDEYMDDDEHMDDDNEPESSFQFTGDFFGNYQEEDFEWPLEGETSNYIILSY